MFVWVISILLVIVVACFANVAFAENFVIKGDFIYSNPDRSLNKHSDSYCVCIDGISQGIFNEIPQEYANLKLIDHSNYVIIPGLVDLHLHASQFNLRGLGMDEELLDWLKKYTFLEEKNFEDKEYAKITYANFVKELVESPTTRAVIFGTIHFDTCLLLMEILDKSGLDTYVGKVNMDRNSPEYYVENTEQSIADTEKYIIESSKFKNTKPIITPRFVPSCSDKLMEGINRLRKKYNLPVQSHLSENPDEIKWVKELCPYASCYGGVYDYFNLLNDDTIMAHCVYSTPEEVDLIKQKGTYIAHCPTSNCNLASGIAPINDYLQKGLKVGFGTDIAAGHDLSVFNEMSCAVQVSKMRNCYIDPSIPPITAEDAFYMATLGGGEFFGNVGSFEKGFEFDALIIDDSNVHTNLKDVKLKTRLKRIIYLYDNCKLISKYVKGNELLN